MLGNDDLRKISFALLIVAVLAGCQSAPTTSGETSAKKDNGGFADVPVGPAETAKPEAPEQREEAKVAVILGPGGYKAFAHTGVIKELRRAGVPIHKIIGVEWGSLVAALYAQRAQVNEAEWKLYKLEKLDLNKTGFFSSKAEAQDVNVLDGFLRENLNVADVGRTVIPFGCPSVRLPGGYVVWHQDGNLAGIVSRCITFPPLFKPNSFNQFEVAGMFSLHQAVQKLRGEGYNIVILVNVLGEGPILGKESRNDLSAQILWDEVRRQLWQMRSEVTDFIDVPTKGFSVTDFGSRKMLSTAGEAAGEKAAKSLANKYGF